MRWKKESLSPQKREPAKPEPVLFFHYSYKEVHLKLLEEQICFLAYRVAFKSSKNASTAASSVAQEVTRRAAEFCASTRLQL